MICEEGREEGEEEEEEEEEEKEERQTRRDRQGKIDEEPVIKNMSLGTKGP